MNVCLIFRRSFLVNKFHDILVASLNSGVGDHAIICSGFFQENLRPNSPRPQYFLSQDPGFIHGLQGVDLTTVGIHSNTWLPSYRQLIVNLRLAGVNVMPLYRNRAPWHAKVYLLEQNGVPIFGVIGSSNMTGRAFGCQGDQGVIGFNHEADVVLWDNNIAELNDFMEEILEDMEPTDVLKLNYREELNGISILDQLDQLKAELDLPHLQLLEVPD